MRIKVEVTGLDEIQRALRDAGRMSADRSKEVLGRKADAAISLARPLVPVKSGKLQASLRKGPPVYNANTGTITASVIVGGAGLGIYPVLQEHVPFRHTTGQAHFLERPLELVGPTIPAEMLKAISPADLGGE